MFPGITIRNPGSIDYSHAKEQIKTRQELGYVVTRPKFTKSRKKFILDWTGDAALYNQLEEGLVTYWSFNEVSGLVLPDISIPGGGHRGRLSNMAGTEWGSGILGNCLELDGSNDRIIVPNHTDFDLIGEYTISLWAKFDVDLDGSLATNHHFFANEGLRSYGFVLRVENSPSNYGKIHFRTNQDGVYTAAITTGLGDFPDDKEWHHLLVRKHSTNVATVYIDNVNKPCSPCTVNNAVASTDDLYIGCTVNGTQYFSGKLGDIRIYNRVLTLSEIKFLYQNGVFDLNRLLNFYDVNKGNSFTFTDPERSTGHTTVFSGPIKYKSVKTGSGLYEAQIELEEV